MTEAQRAKFIEIRRLLDELIYGYQLTDESAFNSSAEIINTNIAAFRVWVADGDYVRGDVRIDPSNGVPYWAIHTHGVTYGQVHQPSMSPTIWAHCHGTTPETARQFVAESYNPYMIGHYCIENGVVKRCNRNNVVHAPSVLPAAWDDC